jgi:uncharacterized RDD family membrane protein YckC
VYEIAGAMTGYFAVGIAQAALVGTTGQSIGKKILRMKIVLENGELPGFLRGVLLRSWVATLCWGIPVVGRAMMLVDAVFVFRRDRRCLHDLLAGTRVIDAQ